jgi:6-pyruvoyltetrahydropterin/6-carboxytetrahydropterin synthase
MAEGATRGGGGHANRRETARARPRAGARAAPPQVRVTRRLHFSAAHRLARADWSDERNLATFGPCASPNWHGHNYEIEVTVEGRVDPETGFVMDLKDLRALVEERVIADVDHRNLNTDVEWMERVNPTTENLVVRIWERIADGLPAGVRLVRVGLWETPRNFVEYRGE